jgi:hypothetical protein
MLSSLVAPPLFGDMPSGLSRPACRLCGARLSHHLLDLGEVPLANRTVTADEAERAYPLRAMICDSCMLVQVPDVAGRDVVAPPDPFLSSRLTSSVDHARRFAEMMCHRLSLDEDALVIEIGSNDGYLLRHFQVAGVPVLGIEAAARPASVANDGGVPTEVGYFNAETAMEIAVRHGRADLVVANNVLPHVPDLFDFAAGFASAVSDATTAVRCVPARYLCVSVAAGRGADPAVGGAAGVRCRAADGSWRVVAYLRMSCGEHARGAAGAEGGAVGGGSGAAGQSGLLCGVWAARGGGAG